MSVSVLLATYNGEKYISDQMDSILKQLSYEDEILVSDDGSEDNTIKIIESYLEKDNRIKLYKNKRLGVIRNFEFLIKRANHEIIFLCDQDDIWLDNKVNETIKCFQETGKKVVLHNGVHFHGKVEDKNYKKIISNRRAGFLNNLLKSNYWGCCMSFKKDFIPHIIPFPKKITAHDQWIGLVSEHQKETYFLDNVLIYHRIHQDNKTRKLSFIDKIMFRVYMLFGFLEYLFTIRDSRF